MKEKLKLSCERCGRSHNTYETAAKCRYKSAYRRGDGAFATLHYDGGRNGLGLLVYLHETIGEALQMYEQRQARV